MASSDIKPYPLMFDPSQWANTYSGYAGKALPFMGQYSGGATGPTDAHGNPIQSYLDAQAAHDAWQPPAQTAPPTTLNTSAVSPGAGYFQTAGPSLALGSQIAPPGSQPGIQAAYGRNFAAFAPPAGTPLTPGSIYGGAALNGGQAARPAAPAPTNPIDMNAAYLQALSRPQGNNRMITPGATVPQANLPSGQSGVLQQFLQNWQGGGGNTQGAGNYNNKGFFAGLQGGQ